MVNYELTINNLLESSVKANEDQEIVYDNKRINYKEFYKNVNNFAKNLLKIGVKKEDRIAILDYDTINYMYCYYSIPMIGATMHMVNIRYPPEILYYTIENSDDRYIIVNSAFMPIIAKYKDMFSFIKGFIIYSENKDEPEENYGLDNVYYTHNMFGDTGYEIEKPGEDSMATLFYTSGTTGLPKGVYYSHRQLVLHALAAVSALADEPITLRKTDAMMPLVPMFHVHAWGIPYFSIMKGMKYVLPGKYDWQNILKTMEKENVTLSAMVPSILYMLLSEKNGPEILGKLKLRATIGGAALNSGLADKAEAIGLSLITGYGMSETGPILTMATYNNYIAKMDDEAKRIYKRKTGIPIPMVNLRVVKDDHDVKKDDSEIGEIIVKAPWLTEGYIKDPEKTEKLWRNGWLHTGDLATMDQYKYIKIVDRENDAVKSGGEFIPSMVLEDLLSTVNGVDEVAVVARKDEKWGERPVAFIKGNAKEDDIRKKMEEYVDTGRIAKFWLPDEYKYIENFEKTGTGKIDKKVLRERLGD